nr:flagellar FliJ family protein [uncultured Actinotalea sp.]
MSGFRLAGLLRLRKLQEEQAAAEVARANAEKAGAVQRRRDTEALLNDAGMPERTDTLAWQVAVASRASLGAMLTEATLAVQAAAAVAEQRTATWSATRVAATTLGKLEERHDETVRLESERAEQLVLDEAATRRATAAGAPTTTGPGTTALSTTTSPGVTR